MLYIAIATISLLPSIYAQVEVRKDPRIHALTPADAARTLDNVAGAIIAVPDADDDGLRDFAIARGPAYRNVSNIDLVSSASFRTIRTLWTNSEHRRVAAWDCGGDVSGDKQPDLVLGFPAERDGRGMVVLVDGVTGSVILELTGDSPHARLGTAVALIADVNKDGRCDVLATAPELDSDKLVIQGDVRQVRPEGQLRYFIFADESRVEMREHWQQCLSHSSALSGYASLRSGSDGAELWRVKGKFPGHGFGAYARVVGDLNGDHAADIVVQCDMRSNGDTLLLSGINGATLDSLHQGFGEVLPVGDLDGDAVQDICITQQDRYLTGASNVQFMSGKDRHDLFRIPCPTSYSNYASAIPLGDVDGDGVSDVAILDADFNVSRAADGSDDSAGRAIDLHSLTLMDALRLESEPEDAFAGESGCMLLYSGRTRTVLMGIWGEAGSRRAFGLSAIAAPDMNKDGLADVLVTDLGKAYLFAGPGRASK